MTDDTSQDDIQRQILRRISGGEAKQYNTLYGGGSFPSYADHPRQSFVGPDGRKTSAAGLYQFQPGTWDEQAKRLGLKDFSPASQDTAAWDLAQRRYKAVTGKDLTSEWRNGNTDLSPLASTWTSLDKGQAGGPPGGQAEGLAGGPAGIPGAVAVLANGPDANRFVADGSASQAGANAMQLLSMMQKLAPQHQFVPVDYDPWKYAPKN